ncbi:MAG: hypothetical protein H9W81_07855 [Enterococcus sp.]|nr:hypothetical protein [Enterococcus sp.]
MNAQQENLMEELANRDFVFIEETDAILYEKDTREGTESVTIFRDDSALHERWNKNGMLVSTNRYKTSSNAEMNRLLIACR